MLASIFSNLSSLSILGYGLLIVGVIATAISAQHRYLLLYTLAGMAYWLVVEVLQTGFVSMTEMTQWHGYVSALMVSWVSLIGWLAYRNVYLVKKQKAQRVAAAKYVEHTPVYKNYHPKYQ